MGNLSSSQSLLPKNVIEHLNMGIMEGIRYDRCDLYNKKINDSMMPELCKWIIKLGDKVKLLNLEHNQITSVGASMLFDTLKIYNSSIKEICLHLNKQIDDKCMKSLGEYIKSNRSIEIISLESTSISDSGIEILAPYLEFNATFKALNLVNNGGITDISKPLLMKIIESSCIEDIGINYTSITQKYKIFVFSLRNKIKNGSASLDVSQKWLSDKDLINICEYMKEFGIDELKEINLKYNDMTSKGASVLFDTLKECKSVVSKLDLSYNRVDGKCMKQLGEYLQDNEYVENLSLRHNKITDKSVEVLSEYLIGNTRLRGLNLSDNQGITDASVPHLIEMVNKSCIIYMNTQDMSISEVKKQEIKEALTIPIEQREIPIKSNTKSAAKASAST